MKRIVVWAVLIVGLVTFVQSAHAKQGFTPPELTLAVVGHNTIKIDSKEDKAKQDAKAGFEAPAWVKEIATELRTRGAKIAPKADLTSLYKANPADLANGKLPDEFSSAIADYVIFIDATVTVAAKNRKGTSYSVDLKINVINTDLNEKTSDLGLKGGGLFEKPELAAEATAKRYKNEIANFAVSVINNDRIHERTIKLFVKGLVVKSKRNKFEHRDDLLDLLAYPLRVSEARGISFNPDGESEFDISVRGLSAGALARIYSQHGFGLAIDKVGKGKIYAHYDPAYGFAVKLYVPVFKNSTRDDTYDKYTETLPSKIEEMLKEAAPYLWPVVWEEGRPDYPKGRKLRKLIRQIKDDAGPALLMTGEIKRNRDGDDVLVLNFYFSLNRKKLLTVKLTGSVEHPEGFAKQIEEAVRLPLLKKLKRYAKKFSSRAKDEIELLEQNLVPIPTP